MKLRRACVTIAVFLLSVCLGGAKSVCGIKLTFYAQGEKFVYVDEYITAPDHTIYEEINRRKINAPINEKIQTVERCLDAGADYSSAFSYCFPKLIATIDKIQKKFSVAPVDSNITFNPNCNPLFSITRDVSGQNVDVDKLYRMILYALKSGKYDLQIPVYKVDASVKVSDNIKLTNLRARFYTDYSNSVSGRKRNIELSLKKINGCVVQPLSEFSFNKTVGSRTAENGYQLAKIIVDGDYVEGYGGGVCQSSTTLYNSALRAGMNITMVRPHTLLPSYVKPSFDAMVNSSGSDLKFINPLSTPVFIRATADGNVACVEFYGEPLDKKIEVKSVEISRSSVPDDEVILDIDGKYFSKPTLTGETLRVSYGQPQVKSEGYLNYYDKNGKLIESKKIRNDVYLSKRGIIAKAP